jgi:hypothetical protein
MISRRILIRLTLLALAAAAVTGLAVLFLPGWSVSGRLALSSAATVAACGLLLVFCGHDQAGRATPLQVTWTVWVGGLLLITLGFLWLDPWMPGRRGGALLWIWAVYGLGAFVVAFAALRERSRQGERSCVLSENLSLIAAAAGFLVGASTMLARPWSNLAFAGGLAAGALALGLGLAAACALGIRTGSRARLVSSLDRRLAQAGVATSLLTTCAWILILWRCFHPLIGDDANRTQDPEPDLLALATAGSTLSLAAALWCSLHPLGFQGWTALLPGACSGLTLMLGSMASILASGRLDLRMDGTLFGRAIFAVLLLDVCCLIAVPVAMRMGRSMRGSHDFVQRIAAWRARCPRCRAEGTLKPGMNACAECGLTILLDFRDDRCPACGYDLHDAATPTCPECGRERQVPTTASA